MSCVLVPDIEERARDEACLTVLNCWEEGWTGGEIAKVIPGYTRNAAIAFVWRIHQADPDALFRKIERAA